MPMDPETTTVVGTGGGLAAVAAVIWRVISARKANTHALRLAKEAKDDVESMKAELTEIKMTLNDAVGQGRRNESGIADIRAQLNTMTAATSAAQTELAAALGRIEGELRARRERGPRTP